MNIRLTVLLLMFFVVLAGQSPAETTGKIDSPETEAVVVSGEEQGETQGEEAHHELPSPYMVIPFVLLLGMIATGPLFYHHFWESHYPKIAIILGIITGSYYLFILQDYHNLMHSVMEYISFIALLSSLFVASGGILIKVERKGTPLLNSIILGIGSVIANVIGTTGASMLLIRPYMKINRKRIKPIHIVFFIFLVSNIGGALTPIGDPPLFLGFLSGVPFFWVIGHVWFIWLPTVFVLLAMFYFWDKRLLKKYEEENNEEEEFTGKIEFKGLKNIIWLVIIIISVFLDPKVISWVPAIPGMPFGIREIIMFAVVYISFKTADKEVLKANEFDWEPIKEVAYLFVGIFLTMIPALQLISYTANQNAELLTDSLFYWATGSLSAFLDNAPTYMNFLSAAMGKYDLSVTVPAEVLEFVALDPEYLVAISIGAVFFGAMTYIGNGPNFMVKAIAERSGVKMPSFVEYMIKYSLPILIPVFVLVWLAYIL